MQPQHIHPGKQLYPRSNIHAKREPRSACLNASSREDWTVLKARSRERRGRQGRGKPGGERAPRKSRRCGYSDSYRGTPSGKMWGAPHPLNKGRKVGSPHRSLSVQMSQLGVLARVTQKQSLSQACVGGPRGRRPRAGGGRDLEVSGLLCGAIGGPCSGLRQGPGMKCGGRCWLLSPPGRGPHPSAGHDASGELPGCPTSCNQAMTGRGVSCTPNSPPDRLSGAEAAVLAVTRARTQGFTRQAPDRPQDVWSHWGSGPITPRSMEMRSCDMGQEGGPGDWEPRNTGETPQQWKSRKPSMRKWCLAAKAQRRWELPGHKGGRRPQPVLWAGAEGSRVGGWVGFVLRAVGAIQGLSRG